MPEIPLVPNRVQPVGGAQLADTSTSRMMGDAMSDFGKAVTGYALSMMQATRINVDKTKQYAVDIAAEEVKKLTRQERMRENFWNPGDDPSGESSIEKLHGYVGQIAPQIMDKYGFGDNPELKARFQLKAIQIANDESFAFANEIQKKSADMALSAQQQRANARIQRVAADPRELPLVFQEIEIDLEQETGLSIEQKTQQRTELYKQATRSAIRGLKHAGGKDGMRAQDHAMAMAIVNSNEVAAVFTEDERNSLMDDIQKTYEGGVSFRNAQQNHEYTVMTRERDERERVATQEAMMDYLNAGNDPRKLNAAMQKAKALVDEGVLTPATFDKIYKFDNPILEEAGDVIGGDMYRMLIDDQAYSQIMRNSKISTAGDKIVNIERWVDAQYKRGRLTSDKREELMRDLQRYRDLDVRERKTFENKLHEMLFNAQLGQAAASGVDLKNQKYIEATFIQSALRNRNSTTGRIDYDNIYTEVGTSLGTGVLAPGQEHKTKAELQKDAAAIRRQLQDPSISRQTREALIKKAADIVRDIKVLDQTIGGKNATDVVPRRSRKRSLTD